MRSGKDQRADESSRRNDTSVVPIVIRYLLWALAGAVPLPALVLAAEANSHRPPGAEFTLAFLAALAAFGAGAFVILRAVVGWISRADGRQGDLATVRVMARVVIGTAGGWGILYLSARLANSHVSTADLAFAPDTYWWVIALAGGLTMVVAGWFVNRKFAAKSLGRRLVRVVPLWAVFLAALTSAGLAIDPHDRRVLSGIMAGEPLLWHRPLRHYLHQLEHGDAEQRAEAASDLNMGATYIDRDRPEEEPPFAGHEARIVPALAKALAADPVRDVRYRAAVGLESIAERVGEEARDAVHALRAGLREEDWVIRSVCVEALGNIGPAAVACVPDLTRLVLAMEGGIADPAARALPRLGAEAESAIPELVSHLSDVDPVRFNPLRTALLGFGAAAAPHLREALASGNADVRSRAAKMLGIIGDPDRDTVAALIGSLEADDDGNVRVEAAIALGSILPEANEPGPGLRALAKAMVHDTWDSVRAVSIRSLGEVGPRADFAAPPFKKAVFDADSWVREEAAKALTAVGVPASEVVLALGEALKFDSTGVREDASLALAKLDAEPRMLVPVLLDALHAPYPDVGKLVLGVLTEMDGEGKLAAVPGLINLLGHGEAHVRTRAAEVLGLGVASVAEDAVPALVGATKDADPGVRYYATLAIGRIGRRADIAVPALIAVLSSAPTDLSDRELRSRAAEALAEFGPHAEAAVGELIKFFDGDDPTGRPQAAMALGCIGPAASAAADLLADAREDRDDRVRIWSTFALGRIDPEFDALTPLIAFLQSDDWSQRWQAAEALGRMGPDAKPAAAALREFLKDPDRAVRDAATEALASIEPAP